MNISLPVALKSWVEDQVKAKGYSTASEFVRDVLRREQAQGTGRAHIDARLSRALDSGPSTPMTKKDWQDIRKQGIAQLRPKRGPERRMRKK